MIMKFLNRYENRLCWNYWWRYVCDNSISYTLNTKMCHNVINSEFKVNVITIVSSQYIPNFSSCDYYGYYYL